MNKRNWLKSALALGALAAVLVSRSGGGGTFVDCAALEMLATIPPKATPLMAQEYRDRAPRPGARPVRQEASAPRPQRRAQRQCQHALELPSSGPSRPGPWPAAAGASTSAWLWG